MELETVYTYSERNHKYEFSKPFRYLIGSVIIYMLLSLIFYFLALYFFYHNVTYAIIKLSNDLENFRNETSGLIELNHIIINICNSTLFSKYCI